MTLSNKESYFIGGGFVLLIYAVVVFSVEFVPSADLPQHLAQFNLFKDYLAGDADLVLNWWYPNTLVFYFVYSVVSIVGEERAGIYLMFFLLAFWNVSVFFYCYRSGRDIGIAILAALFSLNSIFYWGFISFYLSIPFLFFFALEVQRKEGCRWDRILILSLLLFLSHSLTFALAMVVYGLYWIAIYRFKPFDLLVKALPVLPVGLLSIFWFVDMHDFRQASGVTMGAKWLTTIYQRATLDFDWGGVTQLRGGVDYLVLTAVLIWGVVGWRSNKQARSFDGQLYLVILVVLLVVGYFLLPDYYVNTICFNSRWLAVIFTILVILLPTPKFRQSLVAIVASLVFTTFSFVVFVRWDYFDHIEMSGLNRSLSEIPSGSKVLGLDFIKYSQVIHGRPFLQLFAYAQLQKSSKINFSFAEHGTSLISYKIPPKHDWSVGLEWFAENVTHKDISSFDYIVVGALDSSHDKFEALYEVAPVTDFGRWRLYKSL